ncbi:MAG TPA: adenylate/guanylate cyclase domain-containing protein [Pseudomonadales bacterium]
MNSDPGNPVPGAGLSRHIPELAIDWIGRCPERRWQQLDGTLCFADVSGFTALAERLAQRGRVGSEELVETLGAVFATMLGIARERGGTLLKFGGDALLLFFQGDDHPVQAANAAVEMRQALRRAARIPTAVGPLRLSMSVGLHSGPAHFFLVGTTHRELIVLGPAVERVLEAERAAGVGEIVASPEAAAALPRRAFKARADGRLALRWVKATAAPCGPRPCARADERVLRTLFPEALGTYLAPGAPEPQHRMACIAFVRFSGTDALLAEAGADATADALQRTLGPVQEVLADERLSLLTVDVERDGGKLFLATGVPYVQRDDEGAMLRALRRILDLELPLRLRIGVNRGHVFAAEVGDAVRAAFSAMGDTTNTAARISAATPPGRLFAMPSVLDESLTRFAVTPAGPLALKGKKAPVVVYDVGAEQGLRDREGLAVAQFIDRAAELARLREAIADLAGGAGRLISVVGEAGIGKTRLLTEATAGLPGDEVLSVRAEPYGSSSAYRMFRDPLRRLLGIEPGDTAAAMRERLIATVTACCPDLLPMASLIADVVQVPVEPSAEVSAIEPRFRPERTRAAVTALLEALRPGRWIIVVDDAHWCDEASARLLEQIARVCLARPWLMLVARRAEESELDLREGDVVTLGPMPEAAIRKLVRIATEAAPLRPYETEAIVRRAGGNPLFAEEILRAMRNTGSLEAVPESLEAVVAAQVDALDPPAQRVLQYASVLGRSFTTAVLESVLNETGCPFDPGQLQRLQEFLIADGESRLRFRSGLLRDTVYQRVSYRMRRRLHETAGDVMERRADDPALVADALALHYARSGNVAKTWRYGRIAGDRARAKYANADAARFYELALDAARRLPDADPAECIRVWRELGYARLDAGRLEDALESHRRALKLAGHAPLLRAEALYHLAKTKDYRGAFSSALRDLTQGRRLLEPLSDARAAELSAGIEALRAMLLISLDRPLEALEQARRAREVAGRVGDRSSLASALMTEALARLRLQGPGDGSGLREALAIFEDLGAVHSQAVVQGNLGMMAAIAGRWREAADWFRGAEALYLRCGDAVDAAVVAKNLGELLLSQGRLDEAEEELREALRVMRACDWPEGIGIVQTQIGHLLIERGQLTEADELLARTSAEFLDMKQPGSALEATLLRAAGRLLADEPEAALALLGEALRTAGEELGMQKPRLALLKALALAQAGRFDQALAECADGLESALVFGLPYEEGLLGQAAVDIAGAVGRPPEEAAAASARRLADLGVVRAPRSFVLRRVTAPVASA